MRRIFHCVGVCAVFALTTGCGTTVPLKNPLVENTRDPVHGGASREGLAEANIVSNIRCEIQNALFDVYKFGSMPYLGDSWGSQITMKLTWDEMSGVTPTAAYINPMSAMQSFTLGANATASAHSTRVETITFFLQNPKLLKVAKQDDAHHVRRDCRQAEKGIFIESDLRIGEFIFDKATIAGTHEATTTSDPSQPIYSTFQEDLTFVGTLGVGINPTWKLTRVSANTNPNLASATRTVTGDILITLGKMARGKDGRFLAKLESGSDTQHTAGIIGGSTASSIKSQSSFQ